MHCQFYMEGFVKSSKGGKLHDFITFFNIYNVN